jgi:hypothetical protein
MHKKCIECGSPVIGRADKKFCTDSCRTSYHNRLNQKTNNYVRRINYALRRNRRILEKLHEHGLEKISRDDLAQEGFDFKYVTTVFRKNNAVPLCFCYEQGYQIQDNDVVELISNNDIPWIV